MAIPIFFFLQDIHTYWYPNGLLAFKVFYILTFLPDIKVLTLPTFHVPFRYVQLSKFNFLNSTQLHGPRFTGHSAIFYTNVYLPWRFVYTLRVASHSNILYSKVLQANHIFYTHSVPKQLHAIHTFYTITLHIPLRYVEYTIFHALFKYFRH